MGFKTIDNYNEERYHDMLMLKDDGDYVDCVILYRDKNDVLVTGAHYVKSADFQGYVHCLGKGCPACSHGKNGLRVENKLFIPLYILTGPDSGKILFWDRSANFHQTVLEPQVFNNYPNPSEYVFRITRNGARGDYNTRFNFQALGANKDMPYEKILKELDVKMPDYYETICKDWTAEDYERHLNASKDGGHSSNVYVDPDNMPEYKLTPRNDTENDMPDLATMDDTVNVSVDDVKVDF